MRHNRLSEFLLAPPALLYGAIAQTRTQFYRKGWLKSVDLGLPVVSVGNITVGGTGKTPLVSFVARALALQNHKVCILTRGYKRAEPNKRVLVSNSEQILADAQASGDEPFELAAKLLKIAAVVADKNRADAGFWAKEYLGATAFVLDDGFQHLRLKRNLDVLTIDVTNPFGNRKLLPAGILRESLTALKRADLIVLTRANLNAEISNLEFEIKKYNQNCPILLAKNEIINLKPLAEFLDFSAKKQNARIRDLRSDPLMVFCGLGNPAAFFLDLEKAGLKIASDRYFPDHYIYRQSDIDEIELKARDAGAKNLITTAKDAVKLGNLKFGLPCFVAESETVFDDAEPLLQLLKKL